LNRNVGWWWLSHLVLGVRRWVIRVLRVKKRERTREHT
jgi:hypothetical protein